MPVVIVCATYVLNADMSPKLPTVLPPVSAKCASAQSSTTLRLCFFAISIISGILHGRPKVWTGIIHFVCGVICFSISPGSILYVSGSTSTNFTLSPVCRQEFGVAINVIAGQSTSVSPSQLSVSFNVASASCSAVVPLLHITPYFCPCACANPFSNFATYSPCERRPLSRASITYFFSSPVTEAYPTPALSIYIPSIKFTVIF